MDKKEYHKQYRAKNKEKIARQKAERRKTPEYKEWLSKTKEARTIRETEKAKIRRESSLEGWLKSALASAKTRKSKKGTLKGCSLVLEDLIKQHEDQKGLCAISGLPMDYKAGSLLSISIDRIDNSIGYEKQNVQLVCRWANLGRGTNSLEEIGVIVEMLKN